MIPKPPFPFDLTLEEEIASFARLKPRLIEVWDSLTNQEEEPHTAVVIPSLSRQLVARTESSSPAACSRIRCCSASR